MTRDRRDAGGPIPAVVAVLAAAGVMSGWSLRGGLPVPVAATASAARSSDTSWSRRRAAGRRGVDAGAPRPAATRAPAPRRTRPRSRRSAQRGLRLPIDGADVERLKGMFGEQRGGERARTRRSTSLAPRNTPVHAVDDGTIAKLFTSKAGGLTIYQFDPDSASATTTRTSSATRRISPTDSG